MVFDNGLRLKDSIYDVLKWICLICLPAIAVLYTTLAKIWGLPFESEIPATINAIALFLGALIGVSHLNIKAEQGKQPTVTINKKED